MVHPPRRFPSQRRRCHDRSATSTSTAKVPHGGGRVECSFGWPWQGCVARFTGWGGYGWLLVVRGLYISRKRSVVCVLIVGLFHCPVDCVFSFGGGLKTWVNFWLRYWVL